MEDEYYEYGQFRVFKVSKHTARIHHRCEKCFGWIKPGQRYEQVVMLYEGRFTIENTHVDKQECEAGAKEWEAELQDRVRSEAEQALYELGITTPETEA